MNSSIAFIDTEIEPKSRRILDIGSIKDDGSTFHSTSVSKFVQFLQDCDFLCGHNVLNHDLKYLRNGLLDVDIELQNTIDTLYFSPLLFPTKPYHALVKDDKLQTDEANNPLNDAIKARDLFYSEVAAFTNLEDALKQIFYLLLHDKKEFGAFFRYVSFACTGVDIQQLIRYKFNGAICEGAELEGIIVENPIELAYSLSLIHSFIKNKKVHSITPPWVLKSYPEVERILFRLRNRPCITGCRYCNEALNIHKGLKRFFGFDSYRTFGGEPLQEKAVRAAVDKKSILAVFPTGGGKSITFQVPALIAGEVSRGLTIVISPLQSLMKDQVDNLELAGITEAVTINGLLDPIERAKSFERVEDGSASILYISPESLRSRSIERLILGRKIARFVIDEAHCFSSWGQDFRVDYQYIGEFINSIQQTKNLQEAIPVSCFTATAKQKVIEDIRAYFRDTLDLELELFTSKASRTNLQYKVFEKGNEEDKYQAVRDLIEERHCPTIIYVSRTKKAYRLAERLTKDGFLAKPYHGKMDKREKTENQNAFISGEVPIMVATSAFGMGVDKKDIGLVIHYEISDSLENYVQEAGRAGRDQNIVADCFVLFDEEDLSKHFILLNQTKLSIKEIQQVWKAIKNITRYRSQVSNSALEIARKAGWDDNVVQIETRVTTAIAALEDAGYLKRGQNMPRIFANSILSKNAQEAIDKINSSVKFQEKQKKDGIRIIKKLFSSKSRKHANEESAESRVDYISDHLGIVKKDVINIVNLLREEEILKDAKDLTAFVRKGAKKKKTINTVAAYNSIEEFLLPLLEQEEKVLNLKELNEIAEEKGCDAVSISGMKTILNFWSIKNYIKSKRHSYSKNHISVIALHPKGMLLDKLKRRHELSIFIANYLHDICLAMSSKEDLNKDEVLVEFSVHELKMAFENSIASFGDKVSIDEVEDALFYLSRIDAIKIEGGFLVVYNRLTIERLEDDNLKRYTQKDYKRLQQFYENRVQQIHIVGEYAKRMLVDYQDALQFVEDYFQLNYSSFLRKYFPGSKAKELKLKMTPGKFRQLFGTLSPTQLKIINDNSSRYVVVAAGPGSGKTRVLVHKLASLLLMEDVKHEQLLMLTFSRAAATEFKKRLLKLIGNAANFVEIKTFHSYCFDLLGKVGSLEKSDDILRTTVENIKKYEVEPSRVTKTVLVIDEAQDMDANEFSLIRTLMEQNEEMRVVAVGDDDQNIYEFRGASSEYFEKFMQSDRAAKYELVENYRSKSNLVDFSNQFAKTIRNRLKQTPIIPVQSDNGQLKVVRYRNSKLAVPLVDEILRAELTGTTCVLTRTNEEAMQIAGLLLKEDVQAQLIQSNDGFNLYDLVEVRYLLQQVNKSDDVYVIYEDHWEDAKRALINRFENSTNLVLCQKLIRDFEITNPKTRYKSDLEVFIRESKMEDFINATGETIFVSTIHKAKGKEFDNVFLMLDQFNASTDQDRRLLYVAMTRAKTRLHVHLTGNYLNDINAEDLVRLENNDTLAPPQQLAMHLSHKDVWLDYFQSRQKLIGQLSSGDDLFFKEDKCLNAKGQSVLKFSKQFMTKVESLNEKGYRLSSVKVNFIVYWRKEGSEQEVMIVLPEVVFTWGE